MKRQCFQCSSLHLFFSSLGDNHIGDRIPRHRTNDYSEEYASKRREFVTHKAGMNDVSEPLKHMSSYSFDLGVLPGNIENFTGN
jgi:hydroxymethylglutaryl-CoA reductase (NADPH)